MAINTPSAVPAEFSRPRESASRVGAMQKDVNEMLENLIGIDTLDMLSGFFSSPKQK